MYKDIVVCVSETDGRDNTIRTAARFANQINAGLTGVYVKADITTPISPYGLSPYGVVSNDITMLVEKRANEQASKARARFMQTVDELDCNASWLEVPSFEHALKVMTYADLIISSPATYDSGQGHSNIGFINTLVLETGKPVILIPPEWDKSEFGKRVVIGWDESREATRAVQDAMPILKQADHVDAVTVNYKQRLNEVVDISEVSSYLKRRNVNNTFHSEATNKESSSPEQVLLSFAGKTSADLIVVGGYGHTRLREIVLGGVTRNLTKHSDVPVLFSH